MAKKIKFTLEMKNGVQARTLEDLQENFDMEKVVGYFSDGRLQTWLKERYYEDEAEALDKLSKDEPDFHKKLCEVLGVVVSEEELADINVEELEYRKQRIEQLRQYTADPNILDKVEWAAFNQEELGELLDEDVSEIILCNNTFRIPLKQKNKKYIGIGQVEAIIKSDEKVDFESLGISFVHIKFDAKYEKLENQNGDDIYENAINEDGKEKSIALLKQAADIGSAKALCELGIKYVKGDGVDKDENKGIELIEKSAQLGNKDAMFALGEAYYDGIVVKKDNNKALAWRIKGAEHGSSECMTLVGISYVDDDFGRVSYGEAEIWLKKSLKAENKISEISMVYLGHIYSMKNSKLYNPQEAFYWYKKAAELYEIYSFWVGECYLYGIGVVKDRHRAMDWYLKAANSGNDEAMNSLGLIYGNLANEAQSYNERRELQNKEVNWYEKAAEKGNIDGLYNWGYCYHCGIGVNKNIRKAAELYRKAAKRDYLLAMVRLGDIFTFDDAYKVVNASEARKWYEKAANSGSGEAMQGLGTMFDLGKGVKKNERAAFTWYKKAVDAGYVPAMVDLGNMYEEGRYVAKNYVEAARLYKIAVDNGNTMAMRLIGRMYYNGDGVSKNKDLALQWMQRSANAGDSIAKEWLKELNEGKKDGCFITTAVCDTFGKPDDCYELNMFRNFRDNWLKKQADGRKLIHEYYTIAPQIVSAINVLPDAKLIYQRIWNEYLEKCLFFIENNKNVACKEKYMEMVQTLAKKYLVDVKERK